MSISQAAALALSSENDTGDCYSRILFLAQTHTHNFEVIWIEGEPRETKTRPIEEKERERDR